MFLNKIKSTIKKYNMLCKGDRVLVCVSGGADSVCLFHLLNQLRDEYNLSLSVCHFDHMIRKESKKDLELVEKLAAKFGFPFYSKNKDVASYAKKNGLSLEDAGRKLRYEFFIKQAKKLKANKIAVAHTKDDQAETVLMRIVRGAGLKGLSSIPPKRQIEGILIIRPLIETKKKEIEDFLKKKKIKYRVDKTNLKNIYLRNRIRNTLLPLLRKKFNQNIDKTLTELAENIAADYEFISDYADRQFKRCLLRERKDEAVLDINKLEALHKAVRNMVIRKAINNIKGDLKKITYQNIIDINEVISKPQPNLKLNIAGSVKIIKEYNKLIITKKEMKKMELNNALVIPGTTRISNLNLKFQADFAGKNGVNASTLLSINLKSHSKMEEYFDFDKLTAPLFVRFRKEGDRFQPLGMQNEKKLKDFFINEKTPLLKRELTPLVISGNDIAWVCGMRISEKFKVAKDTRTVLRIRLISYFNADSRRYNADSRR